MWRRILWLTVLFVFVVCGASGKADDATIVFTLPVPIPATVTIEVGDTVTWTGASSFHPLQQVTGSTSDTPVSGGFSATSSPFSRQFNTAGTFYYRCTAHGVSALGGTMRGSVVVEERSAETPTPTPDPDETPSSCDVKPGAVSLTTPSSGATVTKARVALDWTEDECATSYRVTVRRGKRNGAVVDKRTTTRSAYKTVRLVRGITYFWSVKACNTRGCTNSGVSSFSIP